MPSRDPVLDSVLVLLAAVLAGAAVSVGIVLAERDMVAHDWHPVLVMRCVGNATCNAGGKP